LSQSKSLTLSFNGDELFDAFTFVTSFWAILGEAIDDILTRLYGKADVQDRFPIFKLLPNYLYICFYSFWWFWG
jgi:hypothetical protein